MGAHQTIPNTCTRIIKIKNHSFANCYFTYYYCNFKKCIYRIANNPYAVLTKIKPKIINEQIWFVFHKFWDSWINIKYELLLEELKAILKRDDVEIDLTNGFEEL